MNSAIATYIFALLIIVGSVVFSRSKGLIGNIQNEYGEGKFYSSEYQNGSGAEDNGIVTIPGKLFSVFLLIAGTMRALRMGSHRLKIEKGIFIAFGFLALFCMYVLVLDTSDPIRTLVEDKNVGMILMTTAILLALLSIIWLKIIAQRSKQTNQNA